MKVKSGDNDVSQIYRRTRLGAVNDERNDLPRYMQLVLRKALPCNFGGFAMFASEHRAWYPKPANL